MATQPRKLGVMGNLNWARWVFLALVFGSSVLGMGGCNLVDNLPAKPAIGKFSKYLETVWSRPLEKALAPQEHRLGLDNGLGRTPPMGWNSWNHFGCNIDEDVISGTAEALVSTGLASLGYHYVNIDDCWAELERDSGGNLVPRSDTFPSGIKALADHVHSLGLKLGLYTDAGELTCSKTQPGSLNHEEQDAKLFSSWDVDYLKYDNCFNDDSPPELRYPVMRDALNKTGRATFFSMCEWGENDPALWGTNVGNSWRTTGDIKDKWRSFTKIADENDKWAEYAGPGGWNDPDMLEVGNGGMNMAEYRTHFSLWALMKAPLLIGCDVRDLTSEVLEILSNKEVIAVNQDPLGVQGRKVVTTPWWWEWWRKREVWAGPLSGGRTVVLLWNRAIKPDTVTVTWEDVLLEAGTRVMVQDLWEHKTWEANYKDGIKAYLAPRASKMLVLTPKGTGLGHEST